MNVTKNHASCSWGRVKMASGSGFGEDVDSRMTCSVCLEPYRGRQPKLLPCFHTFCLPCLSQLAEREARQSVMVC